MTDSTMPLLDPFSELVASTRVDEFAIPVLPDAFARPLLVEALRDKYRVHVDVDNTLLCLRRPLTFAPDTGEVLTFEFLKLSMLDAALRNFQAHECREDAYHSTSGFMRATDTADTYHSTALNVTVSEFLNLCRDLDIGARYQVYVWSFFYSQDVIAQAAFEHTIIIELKEEMKLAADQALASGDIEPGDYRMILSVIMGENSPRMGDKQVWFRTLGLMGLQMTGCMVFYISEKSDYEGDWVVYIPRDPVQPLKRYAWAQINDAFKRLFTNPDASISESVSPTTYQMFFSRFVPFEKKDYYFRQFIRGATDSTSLIWRSPWKRLRDFTIEPGINGIQALPDLVPVALEPNNDPDLSPAARQRGDQGIWANLDPWTFLYEQARDRFIADARAYAVPTADVDAYSEADVIARDTRHATLIEIYKSA